ncbi:MAG TPA: ATP-dependent metallopeptidase FtsH/Yme1/Tma family protein, partial [Geobacterales bacterium]|nr:ATP-dependent metallopeptidase FtsH/Yme1/Tma family protein [Geobacterales bacterium]
MWQSPWRSLLLVSLLFLAMAVISTYTQRFTVSDRGEIHYSLFRSELAKGNIRSVTLKGGELRGDFGTPITLNQGGQSRQIRSFTTFMPSIEDSALLAELQAKGVDVTAERADGPTAMSVFFAILPWLLIFGVWWFVIRGMRAQGPGGVMGGFSRSGAKLYSSESNVKVTFDDVAGMVNAKEELTEVVEFLRDPKRFQRIGGKVPHGVLLVGPPGTGKTLLARAVAGEAGVPFFTISASQFIEMFVGVGASRVRDL